MFPSILVNKHIKTSGMLMQMQNGGTEFPQNSFLLRFTEAGYFQLGQQFQNMLHL
jgi:hypothetical protein